MIVYPLVLSTLNLPCIAYTHILVLVVLCGLCVRVYS